jgi:cob(I)alamin adenosyltransferase
MTTGLVYVFTGEGKGKTSAALGVATRSLLLDKPVTWIAFYKQSAWGLAEAKLSEKFPNLDMHFTGKGFRITQPESVKGSVKLASVGKSGKVVDTASEAEHVAAASDALALAKQQLATQPFLLVLDEVLNAVDEGLLSEQLVLALLASRGSTHVILTGRGVTPQMIEQVDLVTECKKIKHPYDLGKLAVQGLDF